MTGKIIAVLFLAAAVSVSGEMLLHDMEGKELPGTHSAWDAKIGEILDPEEFSDFYRTVTGFFSSQREKYTAPAVRVVLVRQDCMLEEVTAVRIGRPRERPGPVELPVRLIFFSMGSETVKVVLRPDDAAPAGWYVLDVLAE